MFFLLACRACRTYAFTRMNAQSSRSHAIVLLTVAKRQVWQQPKPQSLGGVLRQMFQIMCSRTTKHPAWRVVSIGLRVLCDLLLLMIRRGLICTVVQVIDPTVQGIDAVSMKANVGRLFMVDLAGSERLKKSMSVGKAHFYCQLLITYLVSVQ